MLSAIQANSCKPGFFLKAKKKKKKRFEKAKKNNKKQVKTQESNETSRQWQQETQEPMEKAQVTMERGLHTQLDPTFPEGGPTSSLTLTWALYRISLDGAS